MKIKTMLAILFAGIFSVSTFAATQYAKEQLPEFEKKLAEAKTPFQKFNAAVRIKVGFSEITSFEQIKTISEQVAKEYNITKREMIDNFVISAGLWWWHGKFWKEAADYAFKVDNPRKYYIASVYMNYPITDQERYNLIKEGFLKKYNFGNADKLLTAFNNLLATAESLDNEAETKATLQKLNRIYTPLLVNQKDKYEKLVAAIRLAIQAY